MRPTFTLIALLTISSTAILSDNALAENNKTTGVSCFVARLVDGNYEDQVFGKNKVDDESGDFVIPVSTGHELAVSFVTGALQHVSSEFRRRSDRSFILEKKSADITQKCNEQTALGFSEEVLEAFDGAGKIGDDIYGYSCSATCEKPTRPGGYR